jgi:hypothetical protein
MVMIMVGMVKLLIRSDKNGCNDHSSEFAESLGLPRKAVRLAL